MKELVEINIPENTFKTSSKLVNICQGFGINKVKLYNNISSVVEFQRWWVLKSKLFAQESTCSKEILISTTYRVSLSKQIFE